MRILITGAGGLLGGRLGTLLSGRHETTALVRARPGPEGVASITADLTDSAATEEALRTSGAETVIHCAALSDPEVCEREPERARLENETATRTLAAACRARGARLIFISTDLVFGGAASFSPESSPTAPVMEYGRSKLRAENAAAEESSDVVILRLALVCGRGYGSRLSASESIEQRLLQGSPVTLFDDEWRTPIDPESVAAAIAAVLETPDAQGLFHIAGSERLTRYELGQRLALSLGLDARLIRRASQASHPGAPRPRDVSLDIHHAREALNWEPRPLDTALREGRRG